MAKIYTSIKDYMDTSPTGNTATDLSTTDTTKSVAMADCRGIRSVDWGPALTHELEFTVTAHDDESPAFEPVAVGGFYKVVREEMGMGPLEKEEALWPAAASPSASPSSSPSASPSVSPSASPSGSPSASPSIYEIVNYSQQEQYSYRSFNIPMGEFTSVVAGDDRIGHSMSSYWNGSFTVYDHFHYSLYLYFYLDIPQGSTVSSAYIKLWSSGTGTLTNQCNFRVQARASDDCPIATENSYPTANDGTAWRTGTQPLTTSIANVYIPAGAYGSNDVIPVEGNIASVIQEIVSRSGWVSGNRIGLYVYYYGVETYNDPASHVGMLHPQEYNKTYPPKLLYAYT